MMSVAERKSKALDTERLYLRSLKKEYAQVIFDQWASDPKVSKYMSWSTHKLVHDTLTWLCEVEKNMQSDKFFDWGIFLKDTDQLIGSIGAMYNEEANRYEIGYCLAIPYWHQGIVTEAVRCVVKYLYNDWGIRYFMAKHAEANPASGAVMRKIGMKYQGECEINKFDGSERFASAYYYLDAQDLIES